MPDVGVSGESVATSTAAQDIAIPPRCYAVMFHAPASNTTNVRVAMSGGAATAGTIVVRPGQTKVFDIGLALREAAKGGDVLLAAKFITRVSVVAESGTPTIDIDYLGGWPQI
jgi:hypothetical protein